MEKCLKEIESAFGKRLDMNTEVLNKFDKTTGELLELLSSLTEEQLNIPPFENSWTAGKLGDHLYRSYNVMQILTGTVEDTDRAPDEKLPEIEKLFLDLSIKMDSPKEILPSTKPIKKDTLIDGLKERIASQRNIILTKDLSKICKDFEIPEYGPFTRLEWIGFNTVHTQRHVHQLKNIIQEIQN